MPVGEYPYLSLRAHSRPDRLFNSLCTAPTATETRRPFGVILLIDWSRNLVLNVSVFSRAMLHSSFPPLVFCWTCSRGTPGSGATPSATSPHAMCARPSPPIAPSILTRRHSIIGFLVCMIIVLGSRKNALRNESSSPTHRISSVIGLSLGPCSLLTTKPVYIYMKGGVMHVYFLQCILPTPWI